MILKIVGVFWTVFGLFWTLRPEYLKTRLQRKITRRIKIIVILALLFFGFTLAGSILKARGILTKLAGIAGALIVVRTVMMLTNKTSEKLFEWLKARPIVFFRLLAGTIFIFGLIFIYGR